jgi:hypothetical protein
MKNAAGAVILLGSLLLPSLAPVSARADGVTVGVNVVHPQNMSVEQQNAMLRDLKAAGVHVIRTGIATDDKSLDFVQRVYAQDIKIEWIVGLQYRPDAPMRPWRPKEFPGMWAGPPLSSADPDRFRAYFQPLVDKLESMGITLSGLELGNELNMAAFNPEFPLPDQGKQFGLDDLHHDPEAQQIAKGYLQYLKVLSVLKDIRDHSKLNQYTPILTAGFGAYEAPEGSFGKGSTPDMLSVNATLDFMRANGLDKLVDAYAVHVYPWANAPGEPAAAAGRRSRLAKYVLSECRPAGSPGGKPCWVTEWGFKNNDTSCPVHETDQVTLIEEMRNDFSQYAEQGSLAGLLYYAWVDTAENFGVFRCGALTQSGRLAVAPMEAKNSQTNTASCIECIRIRVGLPRVVRGPGPGIPDNPLTEVNLPNGRFRGFSASSTTYAIDAASPSDMGGTAVPVLSPGPRGQYGDSGEWINHVERSGWTLLAWVHDETGDGPNQGLKSMSLAVSDNDGLSWRRLGQIITGKDSLTPGRITGEGDCTAVDGKDGYYYAYCWRNTNGGTIVARALAANPGPGNWKKYFEGGWSQPGLGGDATKLAPGIGTDTARWSTTGETLNLGWVPGQEGLRLYFSRDYVHFTALPEPLLVADPNVSWAHRLQEPHELMAYWSLLDANTGANQLSDHWLLAYMDLQPHESFDKRYQVLRPIEISRSRKPDEPQVGVILAHWYNARLHDHWSTVAPVPGNYSEYKLEGESGYLMTAADPRQPSVELEDCVSQWPGHPDHILIEKGVCERHGYQRLRTAGWVFSGPQPGTQPLYRCYSDSEKSHFASNSRDCDHLGKRETLLGYDLKE